MEHQWFWAPDVAAALTLDAQLDAIWTALGPYAPAFRRMGPKTQVVVDILIEHHGDDLLLGWVMAERHVAMAAAFGALICVDEYNYTESH